MDEVILNFDDWTPEYNPFTFPNQLDQNTIGKTTPNKMNSVVDSSLIAGLYNVVNSSGIINGNNNITGTDSNQYIISGNGNLVGNNCLNVTINGNNNVVNDGVSNISIQGNNITAKVSNMTYNTNPVIDYFNFIDSGKDVVLPIGSRSLINFIDSGRDVILPYGSNSIINLIISE